MVSTECAARRCSARHALAGIAIVTVASLRHRLTTDSGTDIAILVRRALAEVCTVPVLLVLKNFCSDIINTMLTLLIAKDPFTSSFPPS